MSGFWSEDDKQTIKTLWAEGLSATQISRHFTGRSRNAVLGAVHRMRLATRAPTKTRRHLPCTPRVVQAKPPKLTPPTSEAEDPGPMSPAITTMTVRDVHCKWPYDVGNDYHYCGQALHKDHPFCEFHCRKAYQPKLAAKKAA